MFKQCVLGTIAMVLFFLTFCAIMWYFDAPSVGRFAAMVATWLLTLGSLWVADKGRLPMRSDFFGA